MNFAAINPERERKLQATVGSVLSDRGINGKAGDGSRTHIASLEGWCFTTKLHPQIILYAIKIYAGKPNLSTQNGFNHYHCDSNSTVGTGKVGSFGI